MKTEAATVNIKGKIEAVKDDIKRYKKTQEYANNN